MKAIQQLGYGSPDRVLVLEDVHAPVPADDQVLVSVKAASINSGDCRQVRANPVLIRAIQGWRRPKEPAFGADTAGVVEAVGATVAGIKVGDEVFGTRRGACGELVAGKNFVLKPTNLTFEQAAAVPIAACTALQAVRDKAETKPNDKILINGAGGGVGTFAVQIAAALGAMVTAVTTAEKSDLVRSLGATTVLDRAIDDFTKLSGQFDAIVDIGGDHSIGSSLKALKPGGRLVIVGAHSGVLRRLAVGNLRRRLLRQPVVFFIAEVSAQDLAKLRELIEAGKVTPVIDRCFTLEETAAAVAYAETQNATGKVVITVGMSDA
jgi:NADPH:quinone reductase-like Zn-dependent oxidoreductase